MDQLKRILARLSWRQRITILAVALVVAAGLTALARWNRERDFRPLYTAMSPEDAGAVTARLKESGIEYRLGENGSTILVPSEKVAEVRLQLAAAGLPKSGRLGFELFDRTNFGATDFAEQVNYHRALEGELERSVMSLSEVEQARVHVTLAKDSIFAEARQPAKASVLVRLRPAARLAPQNVAAICYLAASAVQGLDPEAVSVVDMRGNLLNRPRRAASTDGSEPSEASLEYRQKLERDLLAKINATVEPVMGADKYRASVFLDCDFTSGEQSEENFDPSRTVMTSQQRTEDISGAALASGVPGTASNLPRPTSRPGGGAQGVTRRTENVAYQSSRLVRRVKLPQGGIRRMSISILVDHAVRWEGKDAKARRILEPPSPEKLKAIRDLVAATTGFSAERGDQLIVESLPFESTLAWEPPALAGPAAPPSALPGLPKWLADALRQKNVLIAVAAGALAGVFLVVFLIVFLLRKKRGRRGVDVTIPASLPAPESAGTALAESGEDLQKQMEAKLAEQTAQRQRQAAEVLNSLRLPPVTTKKTEVLAKHLAEEAKKDPTGMAQILRTWLNEGEH